MLNAIRKLFGNNDETVWKKEEDIERKQYIQYTQEVETTLRLLEEHLHESDDSVEIIQTVMKTVCRFYQGDWVRFWRWIWNWGYGLRMYGSIRMGRIRQHSFCKSMNRLTFLLSCSKAYKPVTGKFSEILNQTPEVRRRKYRFPNCQIH